MTNEDPFWRDAVVLVTGGSSGLGEAICRRFLSAGARVVPVARDASRLQVAVASWSAAPDRVLPLAADVTLDAEVGRLVQHVQDRFGRLDVLVHAAGRSDRGTVVDTPLDRYRQLWELNTLAAVRLVQQSIGLLRAGKGHLVLIGSLAGKSASRYLGAYPASKFALSAIAQQLRLELHDSNVHVLLVCPGPIRRADAGKRYQQLAQDLPEEAHQPGAGVRLKGIDPDRLADAILHACRRRKPELVVPARARWLFAIQQLWPTWGDWLLRKFTSR